MRSQMFAAAIAVLALTATASPSFPPCRACRISQAIAVTLPDTKATKHAAA